MIDVSSSHNTNSPNLHDSLQSVSHLVRAEKARIRFSRMPVNPETTSQIGYKLILQENPQIGSK